MSYVEQEEAETKSSHRVMITKGLGRTTNHHTDVKLRPRINRNNLWLKSFLLHWKVLAFMPSQKLINWGNKKQLLAIINSKFCLH